MSEIYCVCLAGRQTDLAFPFFKIETAFVYIRDERDCLGKVYMDGLVVRYSLVELIRVFNRAVLYTDSAPGTFALINIPGLFDHRNREVSCFPFYALNLGIGYHLYIGMPFAFNKFRRFDAH